MADTNVTFSSSDQTTVPATGTCPDCGGTVPLTPGGLIDRHQVRIIRGGIETDSDQACIGRGLPPEQVA